MAPIEKDIVRLIADRYDVAPEYPWANDDSAVFRHHDNRKWFALIMNVRRDRLGLTGSDTVPVMNLKIDDPIYHDMITHEDGIMPAYHMNKVHWITVLLDGTVPEEQVSGLLEISYSATSSLGRHRRRKD